MSIGILGQVWYLILSIPDLCTLTNFQSSLIHKLNLSRFKGCLSSIFTTALKQRIIVRTSGDFYLLKTVISFNSGKIKMIKLV